MADADSRDGLSIRPGFQQLRRFVAMAIGAFAAGCSMIDYCHIQHITILAESSIGRLYRMRHHPTHGRDARMHARRWIRTLRNARGAA